MTSPHTDLSVDETASMGNAAAVPRDGVPENALRQEHRNLYHPPPSSYYNPQIPPFPPHGPSYMPHSHPPVPQESAAARASLLIATGGLIGMTAAAALRWLNGEDFSLFPPSPPRQETLPSQKEEQQDNSVDVLTQQMEVVLQEIRMHNKQHEHMLQRLANSSVEKQRTNECVDLLRAAKPSDDDNAMMETLTSIRSELSLIRESLAQHTAEVDWDTKLSDTLDNLQTCMEQMSKSKNSGVLPGPSRSSKITGNATPVIPFVSLKHEDDNDKQSNMQQMDLAASIRILIEQNSPEDLRAGAPLLYLYVSNLSNHPTAPRYRKLYTSNDSFQKVERLVGGKELLVALGFVETGGSCLEWKPEANTEDSMDCHIELLNGAASALKIVKTVSGSTIEPELVERAVTAAALPTQSEGITATCPPTPLQAGILPFAETPEIGLIASPPNPRKHIYDKPEFPLLHARHRVDSPVLSMSPESSHLDRTTESLSPIIRGDEKDTEATDVLWK